jgi:hypothetical protein
MIHGPAKCYDQIKDDDMSRICSTHGREEKCLHNLFENMKGCNHSEDLDIDGSIMLKQASVILLYHFFCMFHVFCIIVLFQLITV